VFPIQSDVINEVFPVSWVVMGESGQPMLKVERLQSKIGKVGGIGGIFGPLPSTF